MLIGNYSVLNKNPGRWLAGNSTAGNAQVQSRANWNHLGAMRNFALPDRGTALTLMAVPDGYNGSAWVCPITAGMLTSYLAGADGSGTVSSAAPAGGVNGEAPLAGAGTISSAVGELIVSAVAALVGAGTISAAAGQAFLNAVASLAGSGTISAATLQALGIAAAGLTGSGSVSTTPSAQGELAADITLQGGTLTTGNVGEYVWNYLIEAGFSAEQIVRLLAAHAAGAAVDLEGSNPRFTGLDGTTVRIDGDYAGGTRTINSLDGS